jgi:hypothetical protein
MFIGKYELNNKISNYIYAKTKEGYEEWYKNTFSPETENIEILDFTIKGKNYNEKKLCAAEIAKDWQINFSQYSWSYGEIVIICNYFKKIGKRYGLLKEFKENCIC